MPQGLRIASGVLGVVVVLVAVLYAGTVSGLCENSTSCGSGDVAIPLGIVGLALMAVAFWPSSGRRR